MRINSLRNSVLRARNLRSARRNRSGKILSSRTSYTSGSSNKGSTNKTSATKPYTSTTKSKQIAMYEKIESSANNIQGNVKKMIDIGKMTYTDDETGKKAQENDKNNIMSGIKSFISDYNMVIGALEDVSGSANLAFKKSLERIVSTNEGALKAVGITVSNAGELALDENTLKTADEEKIKALFASKDGFADKISTKMEGIEKSASTSLNALNKLYGTTSGYNKYGTSSSYNGSYYNNSSWYI